MTMPGGYREAQGCTRPDYARRAAALLVAACVWLAVSPAGAAPAPHCPNPGLDCHRVLVIPVKYTEPYCPDPNQECPDVSPFGDPRLSPSELAQLLAVRVNANLAHWSHGTWQFQFEMLANPDGVDGWWPMPASYQEYFLSWGLGANFWKPGPAPRAIVEDVVQEIAVPASEDGYISPLTTYTRLLIINNGHAPDGQSHVTTYTIPTAGGGAVQHGFSGSLVGEAANDDSLVATLSHELMHQLLGPYDFYGQCLITETSLAPFVDECNGPWDVMAWEQSGPNHPTAYNKLSIGWLPDDPVRVVDLPVPGASHASSWDIHPIEDLDAEHVRLVRIPLATTPVGGAFEGYHVQCRAPILGDERIPEAGVLIQLVREAAPGVAQNGPMAARVIRAAPPFSLSSAALQPGESWVDPARGVAIDFSGYAGGAPDAACQVQVEYAATGTRPDPAFQALAGSSVDLWLDNPANGLSVYPQPVDADGVPLGPGDPFGANQEVLLRFRARNLGTAPTPALTIRLDVEQPPRANCDPNPAPLVPPWTVFTGPIPPGGIEIGWITVHIPEAKAIRVKAQILPVTNEMTTSNNQAQRVFFPGSTAAVVTPDGPTEVTVAATLVNGCPTDLLMSGSPEIFPVEPIPDPDPVLDRWRVDEPALLRLSPGEVAPFTLTFTPPNPIAPPNPVTPGGVTVPLSFQAGGGPASQGALGEPGREIDRFPVHIPVVDPASVTAIVTAGPYLYGSLVVVSGSLTPADPPAALGVRFRSWYGGDVLVPATTDVFGRYLAPFTPPGIGPWTARAIWLGDETRYESASAPVGFLVVPDKPCFGNSDCEDGNPCTQDTCEPRIGRCRYDLFPDGTACDDGDACSTGGTCFAGACGQPLECDDLDSCTEDFCVLGECHSTPAPLDEVGGVTFQGPDQLAWSPTVGASQWNTYRGSIPPALLGSRAQAYDHVCYEAGDELGDGYLASTDGSIPPLQWARYYVVTQEGRCGEGPVGWSTAGLPQTPLIACSADGTEAICDDALDNDADGLVDCADPDCAGIAGCPLCGDGILEPPEECDDGNTTAGDGCASDCTLE